MSVATIIHDVQVEFDDLDGVWCDKDYVLGFVEIANEDLENLIEDLDLSYDTVVLILPAVAAGTTDLSAFEAVGQPLENMMFPVALEWKLPADTNISWRPIPQVDKVVDILTPAPAGSPSATLGIASYEWRSQVIYISPSSVPTDIRIRFENLPSILNTDSSVYIRGLKNSLVYAVCEQICWNRGGGMSKQAPYFTTKKEEAVGLLIDRLVKQEQVTNRRMAGRRSQQPSALWRLPMG